MTETNQTTFLLVNTKALPQALIKVQEAKQLLATGKARHVQEAVEKAKVSRSVFYKYKDMVFAYTPNQGGKAITFTMNLSNVPGLLSQVLSHLAQHRANVLTINQTIPIHQVASVTLTVEAPSQGLTPAFEEIASLEGVTNFRILNKE